jgi:fatty acid desaturase
MPDNHYDDGNSNDPKDRKNQNARAIALILIVAAILFGALAFVAWYFVNEHSERS